MLKINIVTNVIWENWNDVHYPSVKYTLNTKLG